MHYRQEGETNKTTQVQNHTYTMASTIQQQQQQAPSSSSSSSTPVSSHQPTTTTTTTTTITATSASSTTEARLAFEATLKSVGTNLDATLRDRARTLHENALALEKQEDDLRRHTESLARQNDQWEAVADKAREGLKEIGDVQNWAEMIERDLLIVEETLRLVEEDGDDEEGDGVGEDHGLENGEVEGRGDGNGVDPKGKTARKITTPDASSRGGGWFKWW